MKVGERKQEPPGYSQQPNYRPVLVRAIAERDGWNCFYCGQPLTELTAELDHAVPMSRGGKTEADNLRLACSSCNLKKGTQTVEEFLQSEYGRAQQAKRRKFIPEAILERLDRRRVKAAGFKAVRIGVRISDESLRMADARRHRLNYGRGMSRSAYVEMLIRRGCQYGKEARDTRREYAMEHKEGQPE